MKRLAPLLLASCTTFEDPTLVIDLRVLAMTAEPPEQIVDIDLAAPDVVGVIDQLQPSIVCATVADPVRAGALRWSMRACLFDNGRCDPTRPSFEIANGEAPDPETSLSPICAPIVPSLDLVTILADAFENDPFRGAAGLTYTVELEIRAADAPDDQAIFASKELHVTARFPEDRVANHNPTLAEVQMLTPGIDVPLLVRCLAKASRPQFRPRQDVLVFPVEVGDTRENYPVAGLDGSFQRFDESITYQWFTTAGSLADEFTGGPKDLLGNEAQLGTHWIAPDVSVNLEVQLWMVQRDERGGVSVYPFCADVAAF
jgi:hypothetical protein